MPTYVLKKPHEHGGKQYAKDDPITVREAIAKRLPEVFGDPINTAAAEKAAAKSKE
jgi:hypothetical protein